MKYGDAMYSSRPPRGLCGNWLWRCTCKKCGKTFHSTVRSDDICSDCARKEWESKEDKK